jgi:hypothetical protein
MAMISGLGLSAVGAVIAGALAVAAAPQAAETPAPDAEASAEASGEALGRTIESRLRADGPFFTAEERVVIERACGYAPGEWDGFEVSIDDGELRCTNGRRAEGPEVRAVLAAAEPRITARVGRVMASAEVAGAIARVAEVAAAEATREVALAMAELGDELDIDVDVDPDGMDLDADIDVDLDNDADADRDGDDED